MGLHMMEKMQIGQHNMSNTKIHNSNFFRLFELLRISLNMFKFISFHFEKKLQI